MDRFISFILTVYNDVCIIKGKDQWHKIIQQVKVEGSKNTMLFTRTRINFVGPKYQPSNMANIENAWTGQWAYLGKRRIVPVNASFVTSRQVFGSRKISFVERRCCPVVLLWVFANDMCTSPHVLFYRIKKLSTKHSFSILDGETMDEGYVYLDDVLYPYLWEQTRFGFLTPSLPWHRWKIGFVCRK